MTRTIPSADSHITEPPDTYTARIDPAFRDGVPHIVRDDKLGDIFVIPGMNFRRLMWANDFPHSDSTWPWSQDVLAEHTRGLTDTARDAILHDNVAELYGLS